MISGYVQGLLDGIEFKQTAYALDRGSRKPAPSGLASHAMQYRRQKAFEKLGKEPSGTSCPAIDGIIKEADETAGEIADKTVLDAAIVAKCASRRALRNLSLRDADRMGRRTRP